MLSSKLTNYLLVGRLVGRAFAAVATAAEVHNQLDHHHKHDANEAHGLLLIMMLNE